MKPTNLFSCIVAVVLAFAAAACSSDEPSANGGSQRLSGSKVAFSTKVSSDDNTKKIYLGTAYSDGSSSTGSYIPVLWGSGDKVTIYSSNGAGGQQVGVYTATPDGDGSTATLEHSDGDKIVWLESGSQSFYSIFAPADNDGKTYGTIDASGAKTLTIPATQNGTVASASQSSPYAVAFGSATVDDVNQKSSNAVQLNYTLVPGVIRLTIPAGEGIDRVSFSDAVEPLLGTISGSISADGDDLVENGGNITVNLGSLTTTATTVNVYVLPRDLTILVITVSGPNGYCTKTLQTHIGAGTVTDVSFGDSYVLEKGFVMKVNVADDYTIANIWTNTIYYKVNDDAPETLGNGNTKQLSRLKVGDIVRVWETQTGVTFRAWKNAANPLIKKSSANGGDVSLISMPPMNYFTVDDAGQTAADNFFNYFNYGGALTSLPVGSFDTRNIHTVNNYFFAYFNDFGGLTSLPEGSFNTRNITKTGTGFFYYFNGNGALTSLPVGSFNTSGITEGKDNFFSYFNYRATLTSLPVGSFDTSGINKAGSNFFRYFNQEGDLKSLPVGSFDTGNITTAGNAFFGDFNNTGDLISLPVGSFNTSSITTVGASCFFQFNYNGALTSLPKGSFNTENMNPPTSSPLFFSYFNQYGKIPIGSSTADADVKITNVSNATVTVYYSSSSEYVLSGGTFYYKGQ